jgi:hypothetical protein
MRKAFLIVSALLAFAAVSTGVARASTATYDFTLSGTGISGSGAIVVSTTGTPGVDDITGISGSYSNTLAGGFSGTITGLVPGSYSASSPTNVAAAGGNSDTFDNLFFPTDGAPSCLGYAAGGLLDGCGFTFKVGSADFVNIFGNGLGQYGVFDWSPSTVVDFNVPLKATFTLATPESGTFGLTLIGLAMLGLAVIRKRSVQELTQSA